MPRELFFEDTHEAIITQKLWDKAHQRLQHTTRQYSHEELLAGCLFAGYVFCADCGRKLAYETHYYKNGERYYSFRCSNYTNKRTKCTQHYVSENNLQQLVLHLLQRATARIVEDEDVFCTLLKEKWQQQNASVPKQNKKDLIVAQKRYDELDGLISGLYENYVSGILPERQYKSLMIKYDTEQTELEGKIKQLQEDLTEVKVSTIDAKRFIKIIKKYKNPQELTRDMIVELIDKIVVYEPSGRKPNREQRIDIYFNFIGQLELAYTADELSKIKETAQREADKKQAEKDKRAKERARHSEKRKRLNAGKQTADTSLQSVFVSIAESRFTLTAVNNAIAQRTAPIQHSRKPSNKSDLLKKVLTPLRKSSAKFAERSSGRATVEKFFAPKNARLKTVEGNNLIITIQNKKRRMQNGTLHHRRKNRYPIRTHRRLLPPGHPLQRDTAEMHSPTRHKRGIYYQLLTSGKLGYHLEEIDNSANDMLELLVKQMAEKQGVTEQLKASNQMKWVGLMNNIRSAAEEVVLNDLIYA